MTSTFQLQSPTSKGEVCSGQPNVSIHHFIKVKLDYLLVKETFSSTLRLLVTCNWVLFVHLFCEINGYQRIS